MFQPLQASEKVIRFIQKHHRNLVEIDDFSTMKVPFSHRESITLRSRKRNFVVMNVALRDHQNVTSWVDNRHLAAYHPRSIKKPDTIFGTFFLQYVKTLTLPPSAGCSPSSMPSRTVL